MKAELTVLQGDALTMLRTLPDESVHCCVTSPPYWGLRDYGCDGQIGLEDSLDEFLQKLVDVFREVRRVLRSDGTAWVNMGDCYSASGKDRSEAQSVAKSRLQGGLKTQIACSKQPKKTGPGIKPKDLVGQPWMLAFALRADGWFLRRDIIWHKPNPMPESVYDRPTTAHEYIFLLSKAAKYHYDEKAIREPVTGGANSRGRGVNPKCAGWADGPGSHKAIDHALAGGVYKSKARPPRQNESFSAALAGLVEDRNKRSVWTVPSRPYSEAHFATYPPDLIKPCILAGCPAGGTVLDPFGGSGTTGQVALELGRKAILIELNPEYIPLIQRRCTTTRGLGL